jgi:hypothetical protein
VYGSCAVLTPYTQETKEVCVPSQKTARLNIFGMIDRKNHYEGFTTTESITADRIVSFSNTFSCHMRKDTSSYLTILLFPAINKYESCGLSGRKEDSSFCICLPVSAAACCRNVAGGIERGIGAARPCGQGRSVPRCRQGVGDVGGKAFGELLSVCRIGRGGFFFHGNRYLCRNFLGFVIINTVKVK